MLALRTAIRSRLGPNVISTHTRCYRSSPRLFYQPLVEPYTWRVRLWYRRDGTPRSKWKGVFYTAMALSVLTLINSLQEAVDEIYLLSLLVQMQRIDAKYSLYDLSQPTHVRSYLSEIVKHLPNDENKPEDIDLFNKLVEHLMEISPDLHGLLRNELEKLHSLLTQDSTKDPLDTAEAVLQALTNLSGDLVKIWQWAQGFNLGPQAVKDKKADEEDTYEVVG